MSAGPRDPEPAAAARRIAGAVRAAVAPRLGEPDARRRTGVAPGGDATLAIDDVAEAIVEEHARAEGDIGVYTEDRGLVVFGRPRAFLVCDPIDGTRPAAAGLESACVSIAVAPARDDATLGDISFGVVQEIKSGTVFTAERGGGARITRLDGSAGPIRRSENTDLRALYWTAGVRGRPLLPTSVVLEELVDAGSLGGGFFDLGSATFNMTRLVTGQLDAYVDPGRRMVDEVPECEDAFLAVGEGAICTNFPYDVAAAALVVQEAGGVVTAADGAPLDAHPAIGASREHGLAVLAASNASLHGALLDALDRGIARLRAWYRTRSVQQEPPD